LAANGGVFVGHSTPPLDPMQRDFDSTHAEWDVAFSPKGTLFWTVWWSPYGNAGVMKDGTSTFLADDTGPEFLAVDSTNVYWTTDSGSIRRVPIAGGSTTTMIDNVQPRAIATDGVNVYWGNWTTSTTTILSLPVSATGATTPTTLASTTAGIGWYSVRADSANVYWADSAGVHQVPSGGGTVVDLATAEAAAPAIDSSFVYFADVLADTVDKVPIGGGTITQIVDLTAFGPVAETPEIAVTSNALFVTVGFEPSIYEVSPK
jgi:hypothetical protein